MLVAILCQIQATEIDRTRPSSEIMSFFGSIATKRHDIHSNSVLTAITSCKQMKDRPIVNDGRSLYVTKSAEVTAAAVVPYRHQPRRLWLANHPYERLPSEPLNRGLEVCHRQDRGTAFHPASEH